MGFLFKANTIFCKWFGETKKNKYFSNIHFMPFMHCDTSHPQLYNINFLSPFTYEIRTQSLLMIGSCKEPSCSSVVGPLVCHKIPKRQAGNFNFHALFGALFFHQEISLYYVDFFICWKCHNCIFCERFSVYFCWQPIMCGWQYSYQIITLLTGSRHAKYHFLTTLYLRC